MGKKKKQPPPPSREEELEDALVEIDERFDEGKTTASIDAIIDANPEYAPAWFNRGIYRQKMGDLEGALKDVLRFMELDPDDPEGPLQKSAILIERNDLPGAKRACEQALALDDEYLDALCNLGIIALKMKDLDAATKAFEGMIAIDPENASGPCGLAEVHVARGSFDLALASLTRAIELDRDEIVDFARTSPTFDAIRADARFEQLLGR